MNIDYWIQIFELAYKNGESIDLITGEKKRINFVFNDEKKSFLTKEFGSKIFTKLEDYEISEVKSGQISLLEYHFSNKRTIFNEDQHIMIKEAMGVMLAFFYKQIDDEYSFGDINRISDSGALGKTIEEKYSISEGPFLMLAETYWTFKIEVLDLIDKHLLCPLTQILIQIEASLASTFFPLMKPIRPDLTEIYEAQQYFLTKYTNKFKIKQFLSESPVLKKTSQKPTNVEEMNELDGVLYSKDTNKPFNGPAIMKFYGTKLEGILKDGKPDGKWNVYYPSGQKYYQQNYKDGELINSIKWDQEGNIIEND